MLDWEGFVVDAYSKQPVNIYSTVRRHCKPCSVTLNTCVSEVVRSQKKLAIYFS